MVVDHFIVQYSGCCRSAVQLPSLRNLLQMMGVFSMAAGRAGSSTAELDSTELFEADLLVF
jgi:hypothetical protein